MARKGAITAQPIAGRGTTDQSSDTTAQDMADQGITGPGSSDTTIQGGSDTTDDDIPDLDSAGLDIVDQDIADLDFADLHITDQDIPDQDGSDTTDQGPYDITDFVAEHTSLTHLKLCYPEFIPSLLFWERILPLAHLRDLTLTDTRVASDHVDMFWELCTQLERLEFRKLNIQGKPSSLIPRVFPRMRELIMWHFTPCDVDMLLEFTRRCPGLVTIDWLADPGKYDRFVRGFAILMTFAVWQDIRSVHIGSFNITNDETRMILAGMSQVVSFEVHYSPDSFGPDSMDLLRPHFANLRALELRPMVGAITTIAQEIMSSCPLLEQLTVPRVDAAVVAKGKPWVCLKLKALNMSFWFDQHTHSDFQPFVFDQLSRLTRLQDLFVWTIKDAEADSSPNLDFRLESGLDKLSTLSSLRIVCLSEVDQNMTDLEIDWILEHWTNLICVYGMLNQDGGVNDNLKARLRQRGISA
ncbi:hypothetical protein BGX31_011374 [Mortierella sp. GBA43]|nr:hypothetical protein BGX31_011374 [Mortierella sp. GBA43]